MSTASLWRHADFLKLWTGQTISEFGSVVTRTAVPLVGLLVLGAGPRELALLVVAGSSAVLLVGLIAGAWVDRLPRRPVLIWTDIVRAGLLFWVPVAYAFGFLRIEQLYVVAFVESALRTLFHSAYRSYLPALVGRDRLVEGNSKLAMSSSIAEIGAPGLAGALVQIVSAPFAILIDAISFVVSAISLVAIRGREVARPAQIRGAIVREIREGLSVVRRHALLFPMTASSVTLHFFGSFYGTLYSLYLLNDLGLTPFLLGVVISAGGVGSLVGSLFATRIIRRLGIGRAIVVLFIASVAIGILTPLATGPLFLATLMVFLPQLIGDGLQTAESIASITLRQAVTPDRLLGRVNATIDVLEHGVAPLGALVAAAIAESFGVRSAIAIAWVGMASGALFLLFSPLPRLTSAVPVADEEVAAT
ncbi:MAG TPA: MFS transporter [Candidatus Limnocylindria bacterium]|nr:MFS transporter [Candidatus Limnocylindria bacterium]